MAKKLPLRSELKIEETWDLTPLFSSDEAWEKEWQALNDELSIYKNYEGHLKDSAEILWECLQKDDELCIRLERIYSYAHQKQDQDTGNAKYQEFYGKAYELLPTEIFRSHSMTHFSVKSDFFQCECYKNA